jgi:hypothetical protein
MSMNKEKMVTRWNVSVVTTEGIDQVPLDLVPTYRSISNTDKSLPPILLDKLVSSSKIDKSEIKYITHRV